MLRREEETGEGADTKYEFVINGVRLFAATYDEAWLMYLRLI